MNWVTEHDGPFSWGGNCLLQEISVSKQLQTAWRQLAKARAKGDSCEKMERKTERLGIARKRHLLTVLVSISNTWEKGKRDTEPHRRAVKLVGTPSALHAQGHWHLTTNSWGGLTVPSEWPENSMPWGNLRRFEFEWVSRMLERPWCHTSSVWTTRNTWHLCPHTA